MAYTKRQIVTVLSILFLVVLTALASYALHLIRYYSLPIPRLLGALTVGLPAIVGLSVETATQFRRQSAVITSSKNRLQRGHFVTVVVYLLLVLETVIATLSGAHITPASNLTCGLESEWRRLFRNKNGRIVEQIQNALSCCGLHSVVDMAYPFTNKDTPPNMCSTRYDRDTSCFSGWRQLEQKAAGIMLAVAIAVTILIVTDPLDRENSTWLHEILPVDANGGSQAQRTIEYPNEQYRDDPEARASEAPVEAIPTVRDVEGRRMSASRMQPSGLGRGPAEGWGQSEET